MKLIDLLVKELPGRGGWPEAINFKSEFISQDSSGDLWCYPTKPAFNSSLRWLVKGGHGSSVMRAELSSDHATSIITRENYQAALAESQEPVWNGEGLPPVGVTCEHCPGGTTQTEWEIVTVLGISERPGGMFTDYWLRKDNGASYIIGNPYRFRPIRTEAERRREMAVDAICDILDVERCCVARPSLVKIYEAIAAGKIPGVRLTDDAGS